ncbi:uncharacterized protein LOC119688410 [Teleopsis dalmanni]|uniref:uncharacterized protein LOC119688410 n=1 Tax=Teleopsis dalmanni TaxID=139649 RepID=UPI0018CEAC84|nr:uncharacterized protein LOC119688410 [Teleopsis dalmanni]
MSAKRKAGGNGNGPSKRRPKKKESDYEDDVSEDSGDEAKASTNQVEVLIQHDELDPPSKLPEDLLATMDKAPGQLLIAGMVTWDLTGKRDRKNVVKVRPNLFNFHRFTDEMKLTVEDLLSGHFNSICNSVCLREVSVKEKVVTMKSNN